MLKTFKIEHLLPLLGLSATSLLVLGIFFSSGQASIVGSAYLQSFTYADTLLQAFVPLKQLIFLAALLVFGCFCFFILAFAAIWVFLVFELIRELTVYRHKLKKQNLKFLKAEEAIHIDTISAATTKHPELLNLQHLEKLFVIVQRWRKTNIALNKSHDDYVDLLKGQLSGSWYKSESNVPAKKVSLDALFSLLRANKYKKNFLLTISGLMTATSLIIFFYNKHQTETIYLSWLFIALYYAITFILLCIAKFANTKDETQTLSEKALGYSIFGVIVLSFMFLLGRDDVHAKSRLDQYITVELVKGTQKCGRNLAGNSSLLVLESQNKIILVPWQHVESVTYSTTGCFGER